MKKIGIGLVAVCVSVSAHAYQLDCDTFRTNIMIDTEKNEFFFSQNCWNPCRSGSGTLKLTEIGKNTFNVILDEKCALIEPIMSRKMILFIKPDLKSAVLRTEANDTGLQLNCNMR